MLVYYLLLALILLGLPICVYKPHKIKSLIYLLVAFGAMWFLATFRYDIGFDYEVYIETFHLFRAATSMQEVFARGFEPLFTILVWAIGLVTDSPVVFYGVIEFFILAPIVWFIHRYVRPQDTWLATWMFVTLTFWYTSMNFIRQSLATSMVVLGYGFLKNKKPVPFFLIVLAAGMFHKTAFIMIPIYFLCHIPMNVKLGAVYAGVVLVGYLTAPFIFDIVTDYVYTYYKDTIYTSSFSAIFLFVPFVLFGGCLALLPAYRKRCQHADFMANLMMFSAIFWLFITRQFILERFSMYTYTFSILIVPSFLTALEAPAEDVEKLEQLRGEQKHKKDKSKSDAANLKKLEGKISDHKKYYWSAVMALLLITWMYNEFGSNVNHFHGVFPYRSVIPWLDNPPVEEEVDEALQNAAHQALEESQVEMPPFLQQ